MVQGRVIYDLGANNGDDIEYYLQKADRVVAVEANPLLARHIQDRFPAEIRSGRLAVEARVLLSEGVHEPVPFYIHRANHVLSQHAEPAPSDAAHFDRIILPSIDLGALLQTYGEPYYVKIDLEGLDADVLRSLFALGVRPDYISAESHTIDVFALLVAMGRYEAFKMVDGPSVHQRYKNRLIDSGDTRIARSFPEHLAGPFGNDIDGPWLTPTALFPVLAIMGLGWKDIHASRVDKADQGHSPQIRLTVDY